MAFGAAFVFVIMMFNVPMPGGTTGHAVGGTLVAILVGPWAAAIAITVALAVQAFLFGDGGVLALGANSFNMAFVLPFVGYYSYKLIGFKSAKGSVRRALAGATGAFLGITAAAFLTAVELGIQPVLYHAENEQPLYCPYGLGIAIPAMLSEHILLFSWVEAVVTFLVIRCLQREGSL